MLFLEEVWEVFSLRKSNDLSRHIWNVWCDVWWDCGAFVLRLASDSGAAFALSDADHVSNLHDVARNVDDFTVDQDVAVADHLASVEHGLREAETPDDGAESKFEQSQEVQTSVAVHVGRLVKGTSELLFQHVVIASDDLLCEKLFAVFAGAAILQSWAVLTGRIRSLVGWALCFAPNIKADFAADVRFSSSICCHSIFF